MKQTANIKYTSLPINFIIPEELSDIIIQYVDYLNNSDHESIDYYETEIRLILNWCYRESLLTDEQIQLMRDYYQDGGILEVK